ncbi:MAG: hypothetical protein JSR59_24665 [Proteobacteria bacterium]|nr:hypothetical protein [Pseudomonadota bacterium]
MALLAKAHGTPRHVRGRHGHEPLLGYERHDELLMRGQNSFRLRGLVVGECMDYPEVDE